MAPNDNTALNLSTSSVRYGAEYTETFAVRVSAGGTSPKGTVAVQEGSTTICTVSLSAGRGKCSLVATQLAAGSYDVTGVFNPITPGLASSSSASYPLVVKAAVTRTVLRPSKNTVSTGTENHETFNVTVRAVGPTPQGTVAVDAGASTLCTATLDVGVGACSLTAVQLPPGVYSLKAIYTPSSANWAASASVSQLVVKAGGGLPPATVSTTPGPGGAVDSTAVTDSATLFDINDPTGTISFDLFYTTCFSAPIYTDLVTVNGNGNYSTNVGNNPGGYFATSPGTYFWVAAYGGDPNNGQGTSGCGEPVTVTAASPTVDTTQQPASAVVGSTVADQATVTGGDSPTGTVTFNLYDNPNGTGTPLFTDTESLGGGSATSASYTTTATGTDYWVATYNGDGNNNAVSSGTAAEPVTVTAAAPDVTLNDVPNEPIPPDSLVQPEASVSGGDSPTGTVTFSVYTNDNCTGGPVFTDTEDLISGSATSSGYNFDSLSSDPETFYWVATYNGNANNASVSTPCGGSPITITEDV